MALLPAVAIFLQVFTLQHLADATPPDRTAAEATEATLAPMIRAADRPVISDDMLLIISAGKEVPWEPSVFAELASLGRWNENLIVGRIRSGEIAFAITQGGRGDELFDSRYNPAVAEALYAAFPREVTVGGLTLRLPP